LFIFNF